MDRVEYFNKVGAINARICKLSAEICELEAERSRLEREPLTGSILAKCSNDDHVWGTDGVHSNVYCKKCFIDYRTFLIKLRPITSNTL